MHWWTVVHKNIVKQCVDHNCMRTNTSCTAAIQSKWKPTNAYVQRKMLCHLWLTCFFPKLSHFKKLRFCQAKAGEDFLPEEVKVALESIFKCSFPSWGAGTDHSYMRCTSWSLLLSSLSFFFALSLLKSASLHSSPCKLIKVACIALHKGMSIYSKLKIKKINCTGGLWR